MAFDGYPVDASDLSRIPVPPHAASVSHVLIADLTFPGGVTATAVAASGGKRRVETKRELTPFPVRVGPKVELPTPEELGGWFEAGGSPLAVAGVESVAASALETTVRERRWAIVLLLGEGAWDEGRVDAERVRRSLLRLRVPLHVWRISPGEVSAPADWPEAVDASTVERMGDAFAALRMDLASQRIVWLDGRLALSAISLTGRASGVAEAR